MKIIRQATHQDHRQINALRITEFQRSAQFTLLKPEMLLWNRFDDDAVVLSAWDGPCAVATMRAVVVHCLSEAESCVQCRVPKDVALPAMVFNNAATRLEYRGLGLNQLLRYYFLKIALDNRIQSLLSPMYDGAPRIRFMQALGYEFSTPLRSWQKKLSPKAIRILGVLARAKMPHARAYIETHRREIIETYLWKGAPVLFESRNCAAPARKSDLQLVEKAMPMMSARLKNAAAGTHNR